PAQSRPAPPGQQIGTHVVPPCRPGPDTRTPRPSRYASKSGGIRRPTRYFMPDTTGMPGPKTGAITMTRKRPKHCGIYAMPGGSSEIHSLYDRRLADHHADLKTPSAA